LQIWLQNLKSLKFDAKTVLKLQIRKFFFTKSLIFTRFLKNGGSFIISIKANCVDSTAAPDVVYAAECDKLKKAKCKPKEQLTLEPYHRDHAVVVGVYRGAKKAKA